MQYFPSLDGRAVIIPFLIPPPHAGEAGGGMGRVTVTCKTPTLPLPRKGGGNKY